MKKTLLTLAAMLMATTAAFAQKAFNEVFPANFAKGLPAGWSVSHNAITEQVPGGLKITCSQDAPKYRADLYYNSGKSADMNFTINSREYSVFALKFIGSRPASCNLQLNISVKLNPENKDGSWIGNETGWGLNKGNNKYTGDIEDADGNHTYYWAIEGNLWKDAAEDLTIDRIEIKIPDITEESQKSFIVSEINWYKSEEDLKASIETEPVVVNLTTNVKYDNFMDAYNAAVNNDVLSIVAPEVIIADRTAMKSITVEGATGNEKIVQDFNNKLLFNTGSNSNMTFRNLIFEPKQGPGNQPVFEHNANNKTNYVLTLDKVILRKISSSNTNGLFNIKRGVLALNDVTFDDCTVSNAAGFVNINTNNMLRLSGANEGLTVNLTAFNSIEASDLTNETPIKLTLSADMLASVGTATQADGDVNAVVIGDVDPSKFVLTNEGYSLGSDGNGNLVLMVGTGVEEIFGDEDAPVEYFNLQGIKVANPEKGLYIKRQGEKTTKVIF
ncbi:MAG: hypothetical protein K2M93_03780 [Muribaculaceae bacterium]|nr:hypothetical protein [Muribaculaceae bacterium]